MPVQIDEITSSVTTESEAAPQGSARAAAREWEQWYRLRQALERLARDRRRTAAEGFDD